MPQIPALGEEVLIWVVQARNVSLMQLWNLTWCHHIETFSALLVLCEGNLSITSSFPPQHSQHWKQKVINLTTFSSLIAPEVVRMTILGAASDEKVVNMMNCGFSERATNVEKIWYWFHIYFVLSLNKCCSHSSITPVSIVQSFWNFAQSRAVLLPCSVWNIKMIRYLINKLWANEMSQDLGLRWVLDRYPILHSTHDS